MSPSRPNNRFARVSVVVPTLNEERNLPAVLTALPEHAEVIVVDGGSVDRTVEVARQLRPNSKVIQQTRRGKGNALACGFAVATGDVIVMIDADGSTDPAEIPRFLTAIDEGADFAKGSRFRSGGGSDDITPLRRLGNLGLNGLVNVLMGTRFTDLCYGYNAFKREVLVDLDLPRLDLPAPAKGKLWGDGFEIETLINMRAAAAGRRISEVPSIEAPRQFGESNLHAVKDGLRVLKTIFTEFAGSRRRARNAKATAYAEHTPRITNQRSQPQLRSEHAAHTTAPVRTAAPAQATASEY